MTSLKDFYTIRSKSLYTTPTAGDRNEPTRMAFGILEMAPSSSALLLYDINLSTVLARTMSLNLPCLYRNPLQPAYFVFYFVWQPINGLRNSHVKHTPELNGHWSKVATSNHSDCYSCHARIWKRAESYCEPNTLTSRKLSRKELCSALPVSQTNFQGTKKLNVRYRVIPLTDSRFSNINEDSLHSCGFSHQLTSAHENLHPLLYLCNVL